MLEFLVPSSAPPASAPARGGARAGGKDPVRPKARAAAEPRRGAPASYCARAAGKAGAPALTGGSSEGRGGTGDGGPPGRGTEVDRAAAEPPTALLAVGLPFPQDGRGVVFDQRDGVVTESGDTLLSGVYYGIAARDDPARATLLTPELVRWAAEVTSNRRFAWVVLDSPEACCALRAEPDGGKPRVVDADALLEWLRPRLEGAPPHKLPLAAYLAHLRALPLEVHTGPPRFPEVRFDYRARSSDDERARAARALRALAPADFDGLDWSEFDRVADACASDRELAGDVQIDLAGRRVLVSKLRTGLAWTVHTHTRSPVTFHTHPAFRHEGAMSEPPSPEDLIAILLDSAHRGLIWHFVVAPEGVYIFRPSAALLSAYKRDPAGVRSDVEAAYHASCVGAPAVCMKDAVEAVRDAGFVAHGRAAPCRALSDRPDAIPWWNQLGRHEFRDEMARLAAIPPEELLRADWSALAVSREGRTRDATWFQAALRAGAVVRAGAAHTFGDPASKRSYPYRAPGPLMVFFLPGPEDFPRAVPDAAIAAARANAAFWAWAAFLGPKEVMIFRAGPASVEVHAAPLAPAPPAEEREARRGARGAPQEAGPEPPAPPRAVVGGVDYAVGGWGAYEVDRRRARWEWAPKSAKVGGGERPGARYPGQARVSAAAAVRSIVAGARAAPGGGGRQEERGASGGAGRAQQPGALPAAARRFAVELGRLEDRLCDPSADGVWECEPPSALRPAPPAGAGSFTVPALTSAELRAFADDLEAQADPEALAALSADVQAVVGALGGPPLPPVPAVAGPYPPLPPQAVPVADDEGLLQLEADVVPFVAALEGAQAGLAEQLEAATAAVERALRGAPPP